MKKLRYVYIKSYICIEASFFLTIDLVFRNQNNHENITFNYLIIPIGKLMNISCIKVM